MYLFKISRFNSLDFIFTVCVFHFKIPFADRLECRFSLSGLDFSKSFIGTVCKCMKIHELRTLSRFPFYKYTFTTLHFGINMGFPNIHPVHVYNQIWRDFEDFPFWLFHRIKLTFCGETVLGRVAAGLSPNVTAVRPFAKWNRDVKPHKPSF